MIPPRQIPSLWIWIVVAGSVAFAAWAIVEAGIPSMGAGTRAAAAAVNPADARQHVILQQNLDRPGDPELVTLYQAINARHFGGALPAMPVRWEPALAAVGSLAGEAFTLEGMFGHTGSRSAILINPRVKASPGALERALCHEMVHAFLFTSGNPATNHGVAFKTVLRRLSAEGAFEGISASDDERTSLRAWIDAESARLDVEQREMAAIGAEISSDRAELEAAGAPADAAAFERRRQAYNARAVDANARLENDREAQAHFNAEVARYNLMMAYPDGFDEETVVRTKPAIAGAGGR